MIAQDALARIGQASLTSRDGRVRRILPTYLEADGPAASRGAVCMVETRDGAGVLAEVVGVNAQSVVLTPFDPSPATFPGARVSSWLDADHAPVGDPFLGRVVDAFGRPLDGGAPVRASAFGSLAGRVAGPLERTAQAAPLETGIRAIDTLLTLARGQRVGVFAPAGVGKTSLLSQMAKQIEADRVVICLVGERGREVEALWSGLPASVRSRAVVVAATSDQAAAMRARAGSYALALAEHWRDAGRDVLLLLDSATRLAMALRETGLAAGEPPTVRAYTPGVFAAIPRVVERCGALKDGGAISAIFTVLSETEDVDDPISELMKSILDGHIVLSRKLAEQSHFPAIDVTRSVSRLAREAAGPQARALAERAIERLSTYEQARTLIETGVYLSGASPEIDAAIAVRPALTTFLRQRPDERVSAAIAFADLVQALGGDAHG